MIKVENKDFKKLYELVQSNETLKNRLLQMDKRYENKELTYENFLDMVNNNIIPIAKEYGITLTQEDIIDKTKAELDKLSDEDLMDVSGGFSPKAAALTLSTIFLMSLGSGSISSVSALDTGGSSSPSSSISGEARSTGRGLLSILKRLPSSVKLGIQKVASLFKQEGKTLEKDAARDISSSSDSGLDSERQTSTHPETSGISGTHSTSEDASITDKYKIAEEAADITEKDVSDDIDEEDQELLSENSLTKSNVDLIDTKETFEGKTASQSVDEGAERIEEEKMYSREEVTLLANLILKDLKGRPFKSKNGLDFYINAFCERNGINYEKFMSSLDNENDWDAKIDEVLSERLKASSLPDDYVVEIDSASQSVDEGAERIEEEKMYSREEVEKYCDFILDQVGATLGATKFKKAALNRYITNTANAFCVRNQMSYQKLMESLQQYEDLNNKFKEALSKNLTTFSAPSRLSEKSKRMNELLNKILDDIEDYLSDPYRRIITRMEAIKKFAPNDVTEIETYFKEKPKVKEKFIKAYEEIRDEAIRKAGERARKKKADQRASSGTGHASVGRHNSKGLQAESEDMTETLKEILTKIKNKVTEPPEYNLSAMMQLIKSVEPEKHRSIVRYLKNNRTDFKTFKENYKKICSDVSRIVNSTRWILHEVNKIEETKLTFDVETDVKSKISKHFIDPLNVEMENYAGLKEAFNRRINRIYKRKISSILEKQDKSRSIEEIARELFNKKTAKRFVEKAKALGFAEEFKSEPTKGTGEKVAHRSGREAKAVQNVEAAKHKQPKLAEGHRERRRSSADAPREHRHSSTEGRREHRHVEQANAAVPLRYEELLSIAQTAIQGLAVGDAAGVPFEFKHRANIKRKDLPTSHKGFTKPEGATCWWGNGDKYDKGIKQGFWSDDTSMTLCLMSSIVNNDGKLVPNDVMRLFNEWYNKCCYSPNGIRFDIGEQVRAAVNEYAKCNREGGIKGTFKATPNQSAGNGALMRIMPMAFYLAAHPEIDEAEGVKLIKDIAELTHNDVTSYSDVGCVIYTLMNKNLILDRTEGTPQEKLKRAFNAAIKSTKELCSEDLKKTGDKYKRLLKGYNSFAKVKKEDIDTGNGFTPVTLESVMYSLINSSRYMDCIRTAILMGYDTDTVASIAGGTAGILYKGENIPESCKKQLAKATDEKGDFVTIEKCTEDFIKALFKRKK